MRTTLDDIIAAGLVFLAACDSAGPTPPGGDDHPLVPGRIAFSMNVDGNTDVYSVLDGGSDLRRHTTDPAQDGAPSWSPDGSQLAFTSLRDGEARIYRINADGTGEVRLTHGDAGGTTGRDISPAWSRDGTRIAFVHENRIYTMAVDGSDVRLFDPPLPVPPDFTCRSQSSPSWGMDGSIAFAENLCFSIPRVYKARLDGSTAILLAELNPGPSPRLILTATISPTDRLAYVYSLPDEPPPSPDRLNVGPVSGVYVGRPAWAPDGSALVFAWRDSLHDPSRMYVMGADGTGLRLLGLDADADSPAWTR
jgi:TolB protein